MHRASAIRCQIESALAEKMPAALTPRAKMLRPMVASGIAELDTLLDGGFPVGALSEVTGPECSGRTSLVLALLARLTAAGKACAWVDGSNTLHPASAAAAGVDLARLLWVRCGAQDRGHGSVDGAAAPVTRKLAVPAACFATPRPIQGLHGGGHGTHPRMEMRGLSAAVDRLLHDKPAAACRPAAPAGPTACTAGPRPAPQPFALPTHARAPVYDAVEQALRCTDLLLQAGGWSALVLDLGGVVPEVAARIELSTWHRYRVAAEQTQTSLILLSQYPCAKSSSELQLSLAPYATLHAERTVLTGLSAHVTVLRQRFAAAEAHVVPMRKPPQPVREACWQHRSCWTGPR